MNEREQQLRLDIKTCVEGPMLAGLLTELAGLQIAAGRMDEAGGLLQQAYAIRMEELVASCPGAHTSTAVAAAQHPQSHLSEQPQEQQQQQGTQLQEEQQQQQQQQPEQQQLEQHHQQQLEMLRHQQPAASSSEGTDTVEENLPEAADSTSSQQSTAAEHAAAAVGSSKASIESQAVDQQQQSDEDGEWDKSDEWEPDLSSLHTANSFEQSQQQQQQQHVQVQQVGSGLSGGRSAASRADSADWRRPGSSAGSSVRASSQPRGRGKSCCGAASGSDSDQGWDASGVVNQPHIVEVCNLHRGVKTSHIEEFLLGFMWDGTTANVKWVDDEHALAVFPCAEAARVLLDSAQKEFKVRPYHKASGAALQISADELLPPRSARPKTTTAVARRLISNALGNREVRDRAAERALADLRKANKEGKQQRQQQLNEAWGGE